MKLINKRFINEVGDLVKDVEIDLSAPLLQSAEDDVSPDLREFIQIQSDEQLNFYIERVEELAAQGLEDNAEGQVLQQLIHEYYE